MSHLKRQKVPKNWPIYRKGTTYVVKPNFNAQQGVPLLIIVRDILKIAQNRKEVKKAIHEKKILVNTKSATEDKNSLVLYDTLSLVPSKKNYRLELDEKGKFTLSEIKDANKKIAKIIDKKILKKKKIQLNLSDGRNYISDIACKVGDSVLINLENKKIEKSFAMKSKAKVLVVAGKHAGKQGVIEDIKEERKMAKVNFGKDSINILIKHIMIIE